MFETLGLTIPICRFTKSSNSGIYHFPKFSFPVSCQVQRNKTVFIFVNRFRHDWIVQCALSIVGGCLLLGQGIFATRTNHTVVVGKVSNCIFGFTSPLVIYKWGMDGNSIIDFFNGIGTLEERITTRNFLFIICM